MNKRHPKIYHLAMPGFGGFPHDWILSEQEFNVLRKLLAAGLVSAMSAPEFAKAARAAAGRSLQSGPAKPESAKPNNWQEESKLAFIRNLVEDVRVRFPEAGAGEIEATAIRERDAFDQVQAQKIIAEQIQIVFDNVADKRGLMRSVDHDTGKVNYVPKQWAAAPTRVM